MPAVCVSLKRPFYRFDCRESVDSVATEYGVAHLKGLSLRERAQALIDLAHPEDRPLLVEQAKARRILYPDQIFLADSAQLYPNDLTHTAHLQKQYPDLFQGNKALRRRRNAPPVLPLLRRGGLLPLFRPYHGTCRMPKCRRTSTSTGAMCFRSWDWHEGPGQERVIAEARYIKLAEDPVAEVVFVVDEACQGLGIATYLYQILVLTIASNRGLRAFVADVLFSNIAMMKVFRKGGLPVRARLEGGVYHLDIPLNPAPGLKGWIRRG
jgi:hypothetical protein